MSMGVPHLITNLQHYAKPIQFKACDVTAGVVVDGPSLAYHIYYTCLSLRPFARHVLEAAPSYNDIGHACVAWLDYVEVCGLKIEAIFFDGLLPEGKRGVRLSRLQSYLDQLSSFRSLYNSTLPIAAKNTDLKETNAGTLFSPAASSPRLRALPAPPFLVPAVVEALSSSRFAKLTSVIAGEADTYCAEYARCNGCIVFTSDSDLLVHDLGPGSSVVLFKDMESAVDPDELVLRALQYQPSRIASELGLRSLIRLAYEMKKDSAQGFRTSVRKARESTADAAFHEFEASHSSLSEMSHLCTAAKGNRVPAWVLRLSRLDPRVSEFVHQHGTFLSPEMSPGKHFSEGGRYYKMYMPFLIDDPNRASAWRCAAPLRRLAYSMMDLSSASPSIVQEYERRGARIGSTEMSTLPRREIAQSVNSFEETIQHLMQTFQGLEFADAWRMIGLVLLCRHLLEEDRFSRSGIQQLLASQRTRLSWAEIRLRAQLDAFLYSFRIMKQIVGVCIAAHVGRGNSDYAHYLGTLENVLRTFPHVAALHLPLTESLVDPARQADVLSTIFETLEVVHESEDVPATFTEVQGKKRRRRTRNALEADKSRPSYNVTSNKFALLG